MGKKPPKASKANKISGTKKPAKAVILEPTKAFYIQQHEPSKAFAPIFFHILCIPSLDKNIHTKKTFNFAGKHVLHTLGGKHVGLRFWFKHCCPNVFNHGFQGQDVCFHMSGFALSMGLAQLANYS